MTGISVVTGAGGHLGATLARTLAQAGVRVRAVGRHRPASLEGLEVEWRQADVLDPVGIRAAISGADVVYHLAAKISIHGDADGTVWRTNVEGSRNVAEACLGERVSRLVHCASVHALDIEAVNCRVNEDSPRATRPALPVYDRSKAAGEAEVRRAVERGLDAAILLPTGFIGPYDFGPSRMGRLFLALREHSLPALVDGAFDWVDVRDVAAALIAAAERGQAGRAYLVGGHRLSLRELANLAAQVTGVKPPLVTVPMALARIGASLAPSQLFTPEGLRSLAHGPIVMSDRAARELGHRARPPAETVADLYSWFSGWQSPSPSSF